MSVNIGIGAGVELYSDEYDDWFLPSKDELNAMYTNLHLESVGSFANNFYWSSSEATVDADTNAWYQQFNDGQQYDDSKAFTWYVRACRSFTAGEGVYSLRDSGPAGGLIFYVNGTTYYEAAPSDQSSSKAWSNIDDVELAGTGTAIGTGQANTIAIIGQEGHTDSAAKLCNDLVI